MALTEAEAAALERRVAGRLASLGKLVAAVSGGGDSVAALHLLVRTGRHVVVAHYDHRLRPESGDDARFVRELCGRLALEYVEGGADVRRIAQARGWNLEDGARRLRYTFLYKVLADRAPGGAIVVAHTLEDVAETVLLQALRGSAYPVGISPRQKGLIRPLLGERRAVLRRYLEHLGEGWVEDATNASLDRNRAWLRNEVIPLLEQRYPTAQERLAGLAASQQEARAALDEAARRRFPPGAMRLAAYRSAPAAVRKGALAARLRQLGSEPDDGLLTEIDDRALAALDREAGSGAAGPWRRSLPGGGAVEIAYGALRMSAADREPAQLPEEPVVSALQLPAEVDPAVVSRFTGLTLRGLRPGDRIRLPGGRKLVSDLLIDLKVPRATRGSLRVLASDGAARIAPGVGGMVGAGGGQSRSETEGSGGSEVLWIEGVAVAAGAAREGVPNLLDRDRHFMHLALEQAAVAARSDEVPVGAVVVSATGELLAAAHNRSERSSDPTAHAELLALRQAAAATGDWRLAGATLYVTLEPCPMCFGAVLNTHIGRVVYGATNLRDGALGGVTDLSGEGWKRAPDITGGVEARRAERLLREVFEARRRAHEEA